MKLVDNAKTAWKWLSIQVAAVGAAIQGGAAVFPSIKDWLGDTLMHVAGAAIFIGVIAARLVDQKKPDSNG